MPGMSPTMPPLVVVEGVTKRFGASLAVHDISLEVIEGTRHAIVGENGAGKSTLMNCLAGLLRPDSGRIVVGGTELPSTPLGARAAGVALVHQELSLVPALSVAENLTLGAQPRRWGMIDAAERRRQAQVALQALESDIDPDERVERLSLARRQLVEIAKALRTAPRVLILDEPTSSLTPHETDELIGLLKRLASYGMTILYISHRLPEVIELSEVVTVLRDGRVVDTLRTESTDATSLARLMVGRELAAVDSERSTGPFGAPVLVANGVKAASIGEVSLHVDAGEIVGLGGLVGAGRSELARALVGLDPLDAGSVALESENGRVQVSDFRMAIASGVAYVPEDRRREGVAISQTVAQNAAAPSIRELSPRGLLAIGRLRALAERMIEQLDVRPPSTKRRVSQLSGGNQQKVAIGKWLVRDPRVIVLDEPTRGVDVGSKAEIHRHIRGAAAAGAGVLLVSSDLPELLALSDRIAVMRDGRIVAEVSSDQATEEKIMALASGATAHA